MSDYVIVTDSTVDLPLEIIKKMNIKVLPMKVIVNNKTYMENELDIHEFYVQLKNKAEVSTTQVNPLEYEDFFSEYLKQGKDIIYVCFSSGLSGMYNSACIAAKNLKNCYPNNKVIVVDSLCASSGVGCLVYSLAQLKENGAAIEELESWANENKHKICHWFIVDDLYYLKRGGRISSATAIIGSMMNIKPVLFVDENGKLALSENVRGRKKALELIMSKLDLCGDAIKGQYIFISNANCEDDAKNLAAKIKEKFDVKDVIINSITPVISSHTGAGTLALIYPGIKR